MQKKYIVAPRLAGAAPIDADWQDQLAALPGVTIVGSSESRSLILATDDAIRAVKARFGPHLLVEEVLERGPLGD
jgi:hypothetical protein